MVQLLLVARAVILWKLKDYVGMALGNTAVLPEGHYRRLTRFFGKQSQQPEFQLDIQRQIFKVLRQLKYTHLLLFVHAAKPEGDFGGRGNYLSHTKQTNRQNRELLTYDLNRKRNKGSGVSHSPYFVKYHLLALIFPSFSRGKCKRY
jgi:hypothetical protein